MLKIGGKLCRGLPAVHHLHNDTVSALSAACCCEQAFSGGAPPCPRSSCAAAITGDVLLIHGGQTPAGVLHDMHLLNLSTLTWLQVI